MGQSLRKGYLTVSVATSSPLSTSHSLAVVSILLVATSSSGWVYPTAILSLYGFFANCRVAEPFLTPYLIGPRKNISEEVLTNYLFPIWTYKPLIIVQGFFLITELYTVALSQVFLLYDFLQVNYAVVTSTEVAYFSYIYSVIPVENYQRATGYLRSAMLAGYTFGATLGQMLVSLAGMGLDYFYINTITLGIVSVAFLVSFWLPMPQTSMFFKGKKAAAVDCQQEGPQGEKESVTDKDGEGSGKGKMEYNGSAGYCSRENVAAAVHLLWQSFRESYSSRHLIYWSLWWALATAGYVQVFNYIQLMWDHIEPSATSSIYNGGVEAACSLVGKIGVRAGYFRLKVIITRCFTLIMFATMLHSQALSNTRYTVQNTSIYSFQLRNTDDTNDLPKINKGESKTGVK
uniref:Solute carrier family 19 member 3b n=1 Tax=Maylandia zebra TaxID=106582 RepID=A0A3P9BPW6_9CICH